MKTRPILTALSFLTFVMTTWNCFGDQRFSSIGLPSIFSTAVTFPSPTAEITEPDATDSTIRGAMSFPSYRKMQFWANGYYASENIKESERSVGAGHHFLGGLFGLNLPVARGWTLSGYYNYHEGTFRFDPGNTKQTTHLGGIGVYFVSGPVYATVLGTFGGDSYKIRAFDDIYDEETEETVSGELRPKGWQGNALFEAGYDMQTLGLFSLKPFGALQYSYLQMDGIDNETFTFSGNKQKYDALYSLAGARIDVNLRGMETFTWQVRMAWIHQMLNEKDPICNYWFGRIPGTLPPTQPGFAGEFARDIFWLGTGLRLSLFSRLCLTIDYDANINKNRTAHIGSVGIVLSF